MKAHRIIKPHPFETQLKAYYNDQEKLKKINIRNSINNSGNSNVDIDLTIDTTPIAYAMTCFLHSTKQISDEEFAHLISNFKSLLKNNSDPLSDLISNKLISSLKNNSNKKGE
ncbi:hypothetical protein [Priestia aryabhattai]|uniref:hypothetical protein n=1 Tax=Priestia aryabhattai TaxID=412384 RepID=UPI001C8D0714|nr:hypothetical protein [Priestia aryabhattai]MBX9988382.1 hypothetical protein [Priestia aryabhattai]